MGKFTRSQAGVIVSECRTADPSLALSVAPSIYVGLRRFGALKQIKRPYVVNPRLLSGVWRFGAAPKSPLKERMHSGVE